MCGMMSKKNISLILLKRVCAALILIGFLGSQEGVAATFYTIPKESAPLKNTFFIEDLPVALRSHASCSDTRMLLHPLSSFEDRLFMEWKNLLYEWEDTAIRGREQKTDNVLHRAEMDSLSSSGISLFLISIAQNIWYLQKVLSVNRDIITILWFFAWHTGRGDPPVVTRGMNDRGFTLLSVAAFFRSNLFLSFLPASYTFYSVHNKLFTSLLFSCFFRGARFALLAYNPTLGRDDPASTFIIRGEL